MNMFDKEAKERAIKLEESQIVGVYDDDEDLARDIAWDEGKVVGYEEGFKDGAEFGYNKANEELEEKIKVKKLEILELKSQIKKMKCDVIFLIKNRMNDDIDQNIIERLAEKWEIKEND